MLYNAIKELPLLAFLTIFLKLVRKALNVSSVADKLSDWIRAIREYTSCILLTAKLRSLLLDSPIVVSLAGSNLSSAF